MGETRNLRGYGLFRLVGYKPSRGSGRRIAYSPGSEALRSDLIVPYHRRASRAAVSKRDG